MSRQRPALLSAGAVASLALVGGCWSGALSVDSPQVTGRTATACRALVDALPDHVADQPKRDVEPADGYAAAWGDPAIVLRCGIARPADLGPLVTCQEANGVGWYIPESQQTGQPEAITMTTIGRSPYVQVQLPKADWPPAAAMVDLAATIKKHTRLLRPCA